MKPTLHFKMTAASLPSASSGKAAQAQPVRGRFELHPSHQRVADRIDEMNRVRGAGGGVETVTREQVLIGMAAHPAGLTPTALCEAIVGRNDPCVAHRICAVLARETRRGLVAPDSGRGARRTLTEEGRRVAAVMAEAEPLRQAQARAAERNQQRAQSDVASRRVSSIFDYARKVDAGVIR